MPPKDNKKTAIKTTPTGGDAKQAEESEEKVFTNLAQELAHEHPAGRLMERLNALVKKAREGNFEPAITAMALALDIGEFEEAVVIPDAITAILSQVAEGSENISVGDIDDAIHELERLIAEREGRLMTQIAVKQTAAMKLIHETAMKADAVAREKEAMESKLKDVEDKKKEKKKASRSDKKRDGFDLDGEGIDDDDDDDGDSSDSDSSKSSVGDTQFSVICKWSSKASERLAKASYSISQPMIKACQAFIDSVEKGKTHEAKIAMKTMFDLSTEGLTIEGDAAGNKPLSDGVRSGSFGGGSEGKYTITKGSSKQNPLSQTLSQTIDGNEKGNRFAEFANMPIENEEMNEYIAAAEANLMNPKVKLPPCLKRKKDRVVIATDANLALTERVICQKRVFQHLRHAIKRGEKFENQDAYLTIVSRLEEMLKQDKNTPIPAYEVPDEVTLCMETAKKYLHLGSFLIGEIMKLNKDQAAYKYHVNALSLTSEEGQMRADESMSAYVNRMQEIRDRCNSQVSPINLGNFGWPTRGSGPGASHNLYTDTFLAYLCIANLNHVVVKRDSAARSFIDEGLLKRAAEGECTMDEVNDLVARMNKLGIGAVRQRSKKSDVSQSQAFSSMSKSGTKTKRSEKEESKDTRVSPAEKKMKLYKETVKSLGGSGFPNMDRSIDSLNRKVQKVADGHKLLNKTGNTLTVGEKFGTIEHVEMPGRAMGDEQWTQFQVIRDIYGCTTTGQLSNLGKAYQEKHDPKYLDKIESWRVKHGVKAPLREKQYAHSSMSKRKSSKEKKPKRKERKSKRSKKASDSDSDSDSSECTYGTDTDSNYSRSSKRSKGDASGSTSDSGSSSN